MIKALFILISLLSFNSFGQDEFMITKESYDYTIESLDKYQTKLVLEGINLTDYNERLAIPLSERSTITSIEVYEYNGKKWKSSSIINTQTISSLDFSSFFSGVNYIRYEIPGNTNFRFIFNFNEEHTIFLTQMHNEKNIHYTFSLPDGLQLTTDKKEVFHSDFEITKEAFDSSETLHYIIHPENTSPSDFFSDWFAKRIAPLLEIDNNLIPEELAKLYTTEDSISFAETCFDFVKREIRYVDIENGINALIPRQCEKTLRNKLGDCKDMATLLTAIYRHFGFEAYTAISQTNSRSNTFNFPSIGYANHMICALKLNEQWYYLDPTENTCLFGDPSTQTIGTSAFLVEYKPNYFKSIPSAVRSNTFGELFYTIDKNKEEIRLNLNAHGKFNSLFQHIDLTYKKRKESIEKILLKTTQLKWDCDSSFITNEKSSIYLKTNLLNGMHSHMQNKVIYNTSSFLISLENMLAIFSNSNHPLFNSKIKIRLNFTNAIDINLRIDSPFVKKDPKNTLNFQYNLIKTLDKDEFDQDSTSLFWNNFITQPITVSYEN